MENLTYVCDDLRHLVCLPYTVENLHRMADELGVKRCWFHRNASYAHYDIPKRRIEEIREKCLIVDARTMLAIVKNEAPHNLIFDGSLALSSRVTQMICDNYSAPGRAYHNLQHLAEMWHQHTHVSTWDNVEAVRLAILFHDVVYEPTSSDLERRSADFMFGALTMHPFDSKSRAAHLIMLTSQHGSLSTDHVDHDEAHFLDCDMAILGADEARFDEYERGIRLEYKHVPDDTYKVGRLHFVKKCLTKPEIFLTPTFRELYEAKARSNLARLECTLQRT